MDNEWMEIAIDIRKRVIYYKDDIISFKEWFTDYMKTRSSTPAAEVKEACTHDWNYEGFNITRQEKFFKCTKCNEVKYFPDGIL